MLILAWEWEWTWEVECSEAKTCSMEECSEMERACLVIWEALMALMILDLRDLVHFSQVHFQEALGQALLKPKLLWKMERK